MLGGCMGTYTTSLPKGGEIIYEVLYIQKWMYEHYVVMASGISNLTFMRLLPKEEHRRYHILMQKYVQAHERLLRQPEFLESFLARMHVPHGKWVTQDFFKGCCQRLEIVFDHPAWSNFDLNDRVRFVAECVFEGMLWCGVRRASAWKGKSFPKEPEFTFVDQWNAKHVFEFDEIPTVIRPGYTPT